MDIQARIGKRRSSTKNIVSWSHEEGYSLSWLLRNPAEYLMMVVRTLIQMADYYFYTMLGSKLGWLDINLPTVYAVVSFLAFFLSLQMREDFVMRRKIRVRTKLWVLLLCAGSAFLTILAMALNWTPMSYNYILGVQGRYFLPLLIPVLWIAKDRYITVGTELRDKILVITGLVNIWVLVYVYSYTIFAGA